MTNEEHEALLEATAKQLVSIIQEHLNALTPEERERAIAKGDAVIEQFKLERGHV